MRHGSLFSGIGGFDLAAEWMGWENVFHCEINEFCQKVLKHYYPHAELFKDIKQTDFSKYKNKIDIITSGFPCQPYSQAGKRKGKADDRHLWPQMLRAIREVQPTWIVGENVPGLLNWERGMVLAEIKTDLETEGFEVFPPVILPACGKNAPHRRDRLWFVAHSNKCSKGEIRRNDEKMFGLQIEESGTKNGSHLFGRGSNEIIANAENKNARLPFGEKEKNPRLGRNGSDEFITDTEKQRLQKRDAEQIWNGSHPTIKRHGGLFEWSDFPTQSPVCSRDDGLSRELDGITFSKWRTESIKGFGNAIVPQVAYEIFKVIQKMEYEKINLSKT